MSYSFFRSTKHQPKSAPQGSYICEAPEVAEILFKFSDLKTKLNLLKTNDSWKDIFLNYIERIEPNDLNEIAIEAACGGHRDLVFELIQEGANNLNLIAGDAACGGHRDLVFELIQEGANDLNVIACGAAYGGHRDLVFELIQEGADDLNVMIRRAKKNGHFILVEELKNHRGDTAKVIPF